MRTPTRYFPVTETVLAELDFDYYLAEHYHRPHLVQFETGAGFAHPGMSAATRRSETGRRRVVRLDPDDGLAFEPLDTYHYLESSDGDAG
jgi:DNA repair exonuclease SbcCD nuclease subunit